MRRVLQFLTIIAVLVCALHLGEDAYAFEPAGVHASQQVSDDQGHDPSTSDAAPHAIHQHCPVTADLCDGPQVSGIAPRGSLLFAPPVAALRSLSQAPPIEPPLA